MKRGWVVLAVAAIVAGGACDRLDPGRNEVLRAIAATAEGSRRVTYVERAGGQVGEVEATVVDDFRYDARLSVDGVPAASAVVADDARALQVTAPAVLSELARPGAEVPEPLMAGAWVVDPTGAKDLFRRTQSRRVARDRLTEALDVLAYVREAVQQAPGIARYNPDATTYRKEFDPFPAPARGVIRYDLAVPGLPRQDTSAPGAGTLRPPGPRFFRRMSLYVDDGRLVEVRERVNVRSVLADPRTRLAARLSDYGLDLPEGSTHQQAAALLKSLNDLATQQGSELIRERDLVVRIAPLPGDTTVRLPADAIPASLTGIVDHGQLLAQGGA